jgi:cell division inhibitor SepF
MSFKEKLINLVTVPVDEKYDDDEDIDINAKHTEMPIHKNARQEEAERDNKVINIHTTAQLQVVLVKLERFDEVTSVVDHLNKKHTVLLNLESTSKDISRRLIDFLSGVTYVIKGQLKQVSNSAFLITPYNVDIIGDAILDELESSGLLFKH